MKDSQICRLILGEDIVKNESALKELYVKNYYMVENFVLSHGGTKEDAKDVFQDSVIVFYNNVKFKNFELKSKISTYLYSVARNQWLKHIRDTKKASNVDLDTMGDIAISENIHRDLVYTEEQVMISKILTSAGEKCRRLLQLYYFEKLKMKKIALTLGFASEQVAKNQKSKCMKKVKAIVLGSDFYKENLGSKS